MRDYFMTGRNYCAGERAIFRAPILTLPLAADKGVFSLVPGVLVRKGERQQGCKPLIRLHSLRPVLPVPPVPGCGRARAYGRVTRGRARGLPLQRRFQGEQGECQEQGKKE